MTQRPRKSEEEMKKELRSIYEDRDGEMPNLRELDPVRSSRLTRLLVRVIGVLFILSAVSWGGFLLWSRGIFQTQKTLETTIEGPALIRSGERTTFTVRYANTGSVPIAALEMKLNLPPDFTLLASTPEETGERTWTLGSLTPSSDGAVFLTGIFRSEVPSTSTLQAFFTYKPANFSSEFQDIETTTVNLTASVLEVAVTGPPKILSGDEAIYTVNVQNTATEPVEGALVTLSIPKDFLITKSEPAPTAPDVFVWQVPKLEAGALFAVTLRGRYTASANGEQKVEAKVGFSSGGVTLTQATQQAITDVIGSTVAFHLVVNGSAGDVAENLGETLHVSIDYANASDETLSDVVFTLTLTPPTGKETPVAWDAENLAGGTQRGNTVTWNKTNVPDLAKLLPRVEGIFDLRIPLAETLDTTRMTDRFAMKLAVTFAQVGSIARRHTIETSPVFVGINSNLTAAAEARYYAPSGEAVGSGPLPPKVGSATSYRIFWTLTNTLHALRETVMTTTLPSSAAWSDRLQAEHGTITYDDKTRIVSWTVPELPANLGTTTASFDVSITPQAHDANAFMKLTNATSLETIDVVTQSRLTRSFDPLTTELLTDRNAAGKGIVTE